MMINLVSALKYFNEVNIKLTCFTLTAQADEIAIEKQPGFELTGYSEADTFIERMNQGLNKLKKKDKYWNSISKNLISLIDNLEDFYTDYKSILPLITKRTSTPEWLEYLKFMHSQILIGKNASSERCNDFQEISNKMKSSEKLFLNQVNHFNNSLNGDKGALNDLREKGFELFSGLFLSSMSLMTSALAHGYSDISIIYGYLKERALPKRGLVIALVVGAALIGVSIYAITYFVKSLKKIDVQQTMLADEVKSLLIFSNDLHARVLKMEKVSTVTNKLNGTWKLMEINILKLIDGLERKTISTEQVRTIFMASTDQVSKGLAQITNNKSALAGTSVIKSKPNDSIVDTLKKTAQAITT